MKFDSRRLAWIALAGTQILLPGSANAADLSCGKNPTQPHAEVEITSHGMAKLIESATQQLQEKLANDNNLELPTSESFAPTDPKKCTPAALKKIKDLATAYKTCPGIPWGLLPHSPNDPKFKQSFNALVQVEPATFNLQNLKLQDLKIAPLQASCAPGTKQCDVTLSVTSFAMTGDLAATDLATKKQILGVKGITMGLEANGKASKASPASVLTVHVRANLLPDNQLSDFVVIPPNGAQIAVNPSAPVIKINMSSADKQKYADYWAGQGDAIPSNFENEASMVAWQVVQIARRELQNPAMMNALSSMLSKSATTYLSSSVQKKLADLPFINRPYTTTFPVVHLQDFIDLNELGKLAGVMNDDAKTYLAQAQGKQVQSPVDYDTLQSEFARFLAISKGMTTALSLPQVNSELAIWSAEEKQIRDPKVKSLVDAFIAALTAEQARLKVVAQKETNELQLEAAAAEWVNGNGAIIFNMATCFPCLGGQMPSGQALAIEQIGVPGSSDAAVHLSYDYLNTILSDLYEGNNFDFCANFETGTTTCSTKKSSDQTLTGHLLQPPTAGWDPTTQDGNGFYLNLKGLELQFANGPYAKVGKIRADGRVYLGVGAKKTDSGSEVAIQGLKLSNVNITSEQQSALHDIIVAFLNTDAGRSLFQKKVLSVFTGGIDSFPGVKLDQIVPGPKGLDGSMTIDPDFSNQIVSGAFH